MEPKKTNEESRTQKELVLSARTTSFVIASVIMAGFGLFIVGYFVGHNNTITLFGNKLETESFGDQIYSSMCSLCDCQDVHVTDQEEEDEEADVASQTQGVTISSSNRSENSTEKNNADTGSPDSDADQSVSDEHMEEYFAQLVGFGTERAAQQFAQKLSRKEIPVIVRNRQSRTARGRFVTWYQVITERYTNKSELESIVEKLKVEEKLNDVTIVTC